MEECLKNIKRDPGVNIGEVINVANTKAELLDAQKRLSSLNERYDLELVSYFIIKLVQDRGCGIIDII